MVLSPSVSGVHNHSNVAISPADMLSVLIPRVTPLTDAKTFNSAIEPAP